MLLLLDYVIISDSMMTLHSNIQPVQKTSDGNKVVHVLSYNPRFKSQMDRFRVSRTVAALVDCVVKKELQPASVVAEPRYEIVLFSSKSRQRNL